MRKPNPYTVPGEPGLTEHLPTPKVTMGRGALRRLGGLPEGSRIALVVDAYLRSSGLVRALTEETLAGRDCKIVCDVGDEPSFAAIDPFIPAIQEYAPTHIVAIGGGSTMDTAKALWAFYERPELTWDALVGGAPVPAFPGRAALIAVPTTSGTGAEATGATVYKRYDGTKALLIDQAIRPAEVFLDFDLLDSLPKKVIANAGVDALAHVIGAMSMESVNPLDKMICTQTAVRILQSLPKSYAGDPDARAAMHVCAYLAGDEINNAGGGLEHKLDMFAKAYHIPHGEIIGIFLPYTMLYLLGENHYLDLADQLGVPGNTAEEKQRNLVGRIWALYDEMGMPKTIQEAGVPEAEFLERLPDYIEMVKNIGHIYWIKGFQGDDSLRELYLQSYYGIGRKALQ